MDQWGRKAGVLYCSFFSLLGGALLCGSRNVGMFIAARFIAGWGSWGFLAVSTCYPLSEPRLLHSPIYLLLRYGKDIIHNAYWVNSSDIFRRIGSAWNSRLLRRPQWHQHCAWL